MLPTVECNHQKKEIEELEECRVAAAAVYRRASEERGAAATNSTVLCAHQRPTHMGRGVGVAERN